MPEKRPIEVLINTIGDGRRRGPKNLRKLYAQCKKDNNTAWTAAIKNIVTIVAASLTRHHFSTKEYGNDELMDAIAEKAIKDSRLLHGAIHVEYGQPKPPSKKGQRLDRSITGRELRHVNYANVYLETKDGVRRTIRGVTYHLRRCGGEIALGNDILAGLPKILAALGDPKFEHYLAETRERINVQRDTSITCLTNFNMSEAVQKGVEQLGINADALSEYLEQLRYADGISERERAGVDQLLRAVNDTHTDRKSPMNWLYDKMHANWSDDAESMAFRNPKLQASWWMYESSPQDMRAEDMALLWSAVAELKEERGGRVKNLLADAEWILKQDREQDVWQYWGADENGVPIIDLDQPFVRTPLFDMGQAFYNKRDLRPDGSQKSVREKLEQNTITGGEVVSLHRMPQFRNYHKGRILFNTANSNEALGTHATFMRNYKKLQQVYQLCKHIATTEISAGNAETVCEAIAKSAPVRNYAEYRALKELFENGFDRERVLLPPNARADPRNSAIRNVPLRKSREWYDNAALILAKIGLCETEGRSIDDMTIMREHYCLASRIREFDVSIEDALEKIENSLVVYGRSTRQRMGVREFCQFVQSTLPRISRDVRQHGIVSAKYLTPKNRKSPGELGRAYNRVREYQKIEGDTRKAYCYLRKLAKDKNVAFAFTGAFCMEDIHRARYIDTKTAQEIRRTYQEVRTLPAFASIEFEHLDEYLQQLQNTVNELRAKEGSTVFGKPSPFTLTPELAKIVVFQGSMKNPAWYHAQVRELEGVDVNTLI